MPPTRPVAGADTATDWGQAIHDYTFAPAGTRARGSTAQSVSTTAEQLLLDDPLEDPGGWLDDTFNRLVVPTDRGGIYTLACRVTSDNSSATTRAVVKVNGSENVVGAAEGSGSTAITVNLADILTLSVGDELTIWAERRGSGSDPDVVVREIALVRLGDELGA